MRYSLCNQTITLYHVVQIGKDRHYHRTVIQGVYFQNCKNYIVNKTGLTSGNSFLCIIPNRGEKLAISPLDRIVLGECEREFVPNDTTWASFQPDSMVVVRNVDEKYYRNALVHWEVGG